MISKFSSETQKNSYMQWNSSCIIITFQPALLYQKIQKLQQLGVSMIGNIASFVHNNGNIFSYYYYYLSLDQFYNCLIQLQTTRIV